ncbi:hypothetical protein BDN67DRAFT_983385 [Paxillus ammoniavirescens]|nr:hypothetical protein BDN67DRAFT_983385 [Paxillus ammoniavirescens]
MTDYSAPKSLLLATDPSDPGSPMQSVRSPSVDSEDFVQGYLDALCNEIETRIHTAVGMALRDIIDCLDMDTNIPNRSDMAAGSTRLAGNHQADIVTPKAVPAGILKTGVPWVRFSGRRACATLSPCKPVTLTMGKMYAIPGEWKEVIPPL